MSHRYLFGPVASRRLGRSLGVDLIPWKTCTYDCVYCECGRTTDRRLERGVFVPPEEVKAEIEEVLARRPLLDFWTFAGSGEPTLSSSLGEMIRYLKMRTTDRVAVLTNGSLLPQPEVREELLAADLVVPTLSTTQEETFRRIHRPHPALSIAAILEGMIRFREEYGGMIWVEVFVIPGVNTDDAEIAGLREAIARIRPDRVQLNTLDRPAAEPWVQAALWGELERIRTLLGPDRVEIIGRAPPVPHREEEPLDPLEQIRSTLARRPCTVAEIVHMTGLHGAEVGKCLTLLHREGVLETESVGDTLYYRLRQRDTP